MKEIEIFFHGTFLFIKNFKEFPWLSKSKFLSFMNKVEMNENPNNGNEKKSDIFLWEISKSDIIFHWSQNECTQLKWSKTKQDMLESERIFLFQKVVRYINDFWDLFLNKVYAKITAIIRLSLKNLNRIIVKAF